MSKYRIAWLPGDGIGVEVMEAARIVLDALELDAEYIHGDIGWEFWCREGDAFPQRTVDLLKNVDAALFGAITSKPVKAAEAELAPELQGKGLTYRSPIVRMRQLFDLYVCLRPCKAYAGQPAQLQGGDRPRGLPREHRGPLRRGRVLAGARRARHDAGAPSASPSAASPSLGGDEYADLLQDQHEEGLGADRPRRLRVREEARPQEGHDRPQGQRRAGHRRPLPRGGEEGRAGLPRHRSATTPTSTPSACGSSRTRSTTTSSWPRTSTATSSPTCAPRWWAASASAARATSARSSPSSSRPTARPRSTPGKYKVNPIATILAAKMMLDWLGEKEKAEPARAGRRRRSSRRGRSAPTTWAARATTLEMGEAIAAAVAGRTVVRLRPMSAPIVLHEVGLRDGLQMEKQVVPTEQKLAWIEALLAHRGRHRPGRLLRPPGEGPADGRHRRALRALHARPGASPTGVAALRPRPEREGPRARPRLRRRDVLHGRLGLRDPQPEEHRHGRSTRRPSASSPWRRAPLAAGKQVQVSVQSAFGCGFEGPVPEERVLAIVDALPRRRAPEPQPRRHRRPRHPEQVEDLYGRGPRPRPGRRVRLPLPRHLRPGPGQLLRGAAGRRDVLRVARWPASAAAPSPTVAGGNICTEDLVHALQRGGPAARRRPRARSSRSPATSPASSAARCRARSTGPARSPSPPSRVHGGMTPCARSPESASST